MLTAAADVNAVSEEAVAGHFFAYDTGVSSASVYSNSNAQLHARRKKRLRNFRCSLNHRKPELKQRSRVVALPIMSCSHPG